jgi:hypothetical protein
VFSAHAATAQVVGGSIGGIVTDEQASAVVVREGVNLMLDLTMAAYALWTLTYTSGAPRWPRATGSRRRR